MVRIVADRNIPAVEEAFAAICEVRTLRSSEITREALREADLLLCRSTLKVGPALLDGTPVKFVATATIGIDHLDLGYLDSRGIVWAAAPGSNADSVVEWWAAALLTLAERRAISVEKLQVGIVGVGAVGSRVEKLCRALGPAPLLCDPPRALAESGFIVLQDLLAASDVVTLHVPLDGTTSRMIDARALRPGTILINASRGEVVDGASLEASQVTAILDVFENEPAPSVELIAGCEIATPHIAGHSLEGKLRGTQMVYQAACKFLGIAPSWSPSLPPQDPIALGEGSDEALALAALRTRYRIEDDDRALRQIVAGEDRAAQFRRYRENYPPRRELTGVRVALAEPRPRLRAILESLGVSVESNK